MQRFFKKIFIAAIFFLTPSFAFAANLYVSPNSGSLEVGQKITLQLMVSSDQSINAVSSSISVPSSIFAIESVSKNSSVLNFWVTEPSFSSANGTINLEGVSLGGYSSGSGNIVTFTLRAKSEGTGSINITNGQILANDGQGTNITGSLNGSTLTVKPAAPKPTPTKETPKEKVDEEEEPEEIEEQKEPTLLAPKIFSFVSEGKRFISGSSTIKNSDVLLTFESSQSDRIFTTGKTDEFGSFIMSSPSALKSGKYNVSAVIIQEDKTNSLESNVITVEIGNIVSDIDLRIKIILSILIALLLIALIKLFFLINRNGNFKNISEKETSEAQNILKKSFEIIESDLDKMVKSDNLKRKEKLYKNLKQELKEASKIISKEIKDIK